MSDPTEIFSDELAVDQVYELSAGPFCQHELHVVAFRGEEEVSQLFKYTVDVATLEDVEMVGALVLGRSATLTLHAPDGAARVIKGMVRSVAPREPMLVSGLTRGEVGQAAFLTLEIEPMLSLLRDRKTSRIFQDKTAKQIVSTILREWRIGHRWNIFEHHERLSYCVQYDETDFDFIQRILADAGIFYYFESPAGALEGLLGSATGIDIVGAAGAVTDAVEMASDLSGVISAATGANNDLGDALGSASEYLNAATGCVVFGDAAMSYGLIADGLSAALSLVPGLAGSGAMTALGGAGVLGGAFGVASAGFGQLIDAVGGPAGLAGPPILDFNSNVWGRPGSDQVYRFRLRRQIGTTRVRLRDYDFTHPHCDLVGTSGVSAESALRLGGRLATSALSALSSVGRQTAASARNAGHAVSWASGNRIGRAFAAGVMQEASGILASQRVVYQYAPPVDAQLPDDDRHDQETARRKLQELQRRDTVGTGSSNSRRVYPGLSFTLDGHPEPSLDAGYVVTKMTCEGWNPGLVQRMPKDRAGTAGMEGSVFVDPENRERTPFQNEFECVPLDVVFRPEIPERSVMQVLENAVVVGPENHEIFTDAFGRVKVQFRWDYDNAPNEHSSCWLRVMQSWNGDGFGTQFLPRVGMEVLVSFLQGDVDKPVVIGCLPNQTHPCPVPMPGQATRSGIVTRSTPGSSGYNALLFEDLAGSEEVILRAERDLNVSVGADRDANVLGNDTSYVEGNQTERVIGTLESTVDGDVTTTLRRNRVTTIDGDTRDEVRGSRRTRVTGDVHERIAGALETVVDGAQRNRVGGEVRTHVDGAVRGNFEAEAIAQVRGCSVVTVGHPTHERSLLFHVNGQARAESSKLIEVTSEERVRLRCGESYLEITPDSIVLSSPKVVIDGKTIHTRGDSFEVVTREATSLRGKKVELFAGAARVGVSQEGSAVEIHGDTIDLSRPGQTPASRKARKPKVTKLKVELVLVSHGQPGPAHPAANVRFLVVAPGDDGMQFSGVTDAHGEAVIDIDCACAVSLPDHPVSAWNQRPPACAQSTEAPRYHVIRAGEHLHDIAYHYDVASDDIWNAAQNRELTHRTGVTRDILPPGEALFIPRTAAAPPEPIMIAPGSTSTTLTLRIPTVDVHLELHDGERPVSGEYHAEGGLPERGTISGGNVTLEVPVTRRHVYLSTLDARGNPTARYAIEIGGLDPIDTESGQRQRLAQLGFAAAAELPESLRNAFLAFQRREHLHVDGLPTRETLGRLTSAFGC